MTMNNDLIGMMSKRGSINRSQENIQQDIPALDARPQNSIYDTS